MANFAASKNLGSGYPTPGPQNPDIQDVMNHAYFLTEGQWKEARENKTYDYIVIGSGFCGYAFAERILTKDPEARILMIERGGFLLPTHFQNLGTSYKKLVGPISETFPWSLSHETMVQPAPYRVTQHGMLPYFGGRSFLWSAWCPVPEKDQVTGWPAALTNSLHNTAKEEEGKEVSVDYYAEAKRLLHVHYSNELPHMRLLPKEAMETNPFNLPVFGKLQEEIKIRVEEIIATPPAAGDYYFKKVEYASLACGDGEDKGIDFNKFSTPSAILSLADNTRDKDGQLRLDIVTRCLVTRLINDGALIYGLETSRGTLNTNNAQVILATGSMPPATLIQNSFNKVHAGAHFTAHTISAITARVPLSNLSFPETGALNMGALYIPGFTEEGQQFHIQLSIINDNNPKVHEELAMRYMPDVVSTASPEQLKDSEKYVILVCAILGELDFHNEQSFFHKNADANPTCNSTLQCVISPKEQNTWNTMGKATYELLESMFGSQLEYWYSDLNFYQEEQTGSFEKKIVDRKKRKAQINKWVAVQDKPLFPHVPAMVHEGSTLPIYDQNDREAKGAVNLNYKLQTTNGKEVENLFITGASLWPQSGAWNPTLTMVAMTQQLADQRLAERHQQKDKQFSHTDIATVNLATAY